MRIHEETARNVSSEKLGKIEDPVLEKHIEA